MTIRVLIADDHPVVRSGVRGFLSDHADIAVVGEAENGEEALCLVESLKPDVLLMDLKMPGITAEEVMCALQARPAAPAVLILTAFGEPEYVRSMLQAGAHGYLLKEADPETVVDALRAVAAGVTWVGPKLLDGLVNGEAEEIERLTVREREVIALVGQGLNNHRIAEKIGIRERTVRFHLENLMNKLGVKNRVEAVLAAVRRGWIDP